MSRLVNFWSSLDPARFVYCPRVRPVPRPQAKKWDFWVRIDWFCSLLLIKTVRVFFLLHKASFVIIQLRTPHIMKKMNKRFWIESQIEFFKPRFVNPLVHFEIIAPNWQYHNRKSLVYLTLKQRNFFLSLRSEFQYLVTSNDL